MSEPEWKRKRADWGFGYNHPPRPRKKKKGCCARALLPFAAAAGLALARIRGLI
jgi:hypothetical protein